MAAAARRVESASLTVLEALRDSLLAAGRYNPNDMTAPAAVLWADPDRQWGPVIEPLQMIMPELFILGDYEPAKKRGPAIWLRCVMERMLPTVEWPEEKVPVIYLAGISRQVLRAGQECPDALKPLVELQYRGVCWTQKNGKDWTIEAFLVAKDGGLGLDMARDAATRASLLAALSELVKSPVAKFFGKQLDAEDFDKLMLEDPVKDLLAWLNNPKETAAAWPPGKWNAFRSNCKADFNFDPEKDGELVGGERLGHRQDNWRAVWDRFAESSALYPGILELLRKSMPAQQRSPEYNSSWPQINESMEEELRRQLLLTENTEPSEARQKIFKLEKSHGVRRDWVWSRLSKAPLSHALKHLALLAIRTEVNLGGVSLQAMAELYAAGAWEADLAAVEAISSVKSAADAQAVQAAVRSIYLPWLQNSAEHFQKLMEEAPLPTRKNAEAAPGSTGDGCVVVFADGLRLDLAQKLVAQMRRQGFEPTLTTRWSGMPTVTATAKAIVSPAARKLSGDLPGEDFLPLLTETRQTLTTDRFRKLLESEGFQVLGPEETGDVSGRAWTEQGELDKLGHSLQKKLAYRIDEQLELLIERVASLAAAGWKEVRIMTDHGWLLMPGGLPAVNLPKYLTESRWARCAAIKAGSKVECPTAPWYWDPHQHVAIGPGISCFINGFEYAHGGASL